MIKTLILGIIQGLTEFLPVSSSGHLVLAQHFLNKGAISPDLSLEIFLHFGSLIAVLIYFYKDILELCISCFKWDKSEKTKSLHKQVYFIIAATFITGIIGILFEEFIEALFSKALVVAFLLIVTGIILFISDKLKAGKLKIEELGFFKALFIGLGQAIAIAPGISRSGTTIVFSLFTGLKRDEAAKFSFILSIPVILGANLLKIKDLLALDSSVLLNYFVGFIGAFVSGLLVISLLLKMIRNAQLKYFAYYCWLVSLITIILIIHGF
ncbi:MAG TPA: undecaprenyl-diphosphate phosphatase [Candidatus Cloacimonadota bacterium]|jgi:undecaprenyl-diphosphatase|nr:undecaprenyl-diphosphate phosphatase [Candidatus Cloacimonadota bacterium]HOQ79948.1 undecaprenyl-diphosphate phosphatase [Candidatus Cloacimonadota bacterium]HPK40778.1 undecaprenyl-diphosphate phosphatase [Candidatus Cloacimonadota bacterium]